jgi:hypothetical protein
MNVTAFGLDPDAEDYFVHFTKSRDKYIAVGPLAPVECDPTLSTTKWCLQFNTPRW